MTTPTRFSAALFLVAVSGCVPTPPAPAPIREATPVGASFEETWAAAIDHFAESNVPIATIDKASGLIATHQLSVTPGDAAEFADCGVSGLGAPILASSVVYNVLVRGDAVASTVKVTASWAGAPTPCSTRGTWESIAELFIRERSEGLAPGSLVAERFPAKTPQGAGFVASASRKTVYPIRGSCAIPDSLPASDLLYFSVVTDAVQQGFRKSSDPGCEISDGR